VAFFILALLPSFFFHFFFSNFKVILGRKMQKCLIWHATIVQGADATFLSLEA
jgi:hypothetical protein